MIEHPGLMTHDSIPPSNGAASKSTTDSRQSVGVEDAGDRIADLDRAMRKLPDGESARAME